MTDSEPDPFEPPLERWLPYGLAGLAIPLGLVVLSFEPLPGPRANLLVGGAAIAAATGSVLYLIARHSGPGERGPDF